MTRLAVIADDLTGALDACAPFAARGLSTLVALAPEALPACLDRSPQIVGVSTNSRELQQDAARQAVGACLSRLPKGLPIFKKIDSRLKGNIAAELDAIAYRRALVVPAIPAFGRWVGNAHLAGFGVDRPIDIPQRLGVHAERADVPDVATRADIAVALAQYPYHLPVGARGLAEALAERLAADAPASGKQLDAAAVTFVIGSTDPITAAQVHALRRAAPYLAYVAAPAGTAPAHLPARSEITLIEATATDGPCDPAEVATGLARILSRMGFAAGQALVVSGGATAQVVLGYLGIDMLELEGEVLPGVPIARVGAFRIVTKSGGFGTPDTLVKLLGSRPAQ